MKNSNCGLGGDGFVAGVQHRLTGLPVCPVSCVRLIPQANIEWLPFHYIRGSLTEGPDWSLIRRQLFIALN